MLFGTLEGRKTSRVKYVNVDFFVIGLIYFHFTCLPVLLSVINRFLNGDYLFWSLNLSPFTYKPTLLKPALLHRTRSPAEILSMPLVLYPLISITSSAVNRARNSVWD